MEGRYAPPLDGNIVGGDAWREMPLEDVAGDTLCCSMATMHGEKFHQLLADIIGRGMLFV